MSAPVCARSRTGVLVLLPLLLNVRLAAADVYLSNPRGSNNRLDENTRQRSNGNRLFDSQNNDRGGYNVGSLYYYEGSQLSIEWTSQHSCSGPNNNCQLILQYMCGDNVRDGATTTTIPDNPSQCTNLNCDSDKRYGMHEDSAYYLQCRLRQRNKGLFTADQQLKGETARYTRQNPEGTRRGYECPEERDYYPYWQPSPWVDIAILTTDVGRCPFYQRESQNVKSRWACVLPADLLQQNAVSGRLVIPSTEGACKNFTWPVNNPNGTRAVWQEVRAQAVAAPDCREAEYSRDNYLGDGLGGYPISYNWTIPDFIISEKCILRIRYNVSTNDFDSWSQLVNFSLNSKGANTPSAVDLSSSLGFAKQSSASQRNYVFKNNPEVQLFPDAPGFALRLAVNTAQYGRVFEDRSHTFAIRKRPDKYKSARIFNLNVRGKRGNIVQTFPAVEYDFVPAKLVMSTGDYVHMQWTGSNTNPNDAGQGLAGTDRSNIVLLANRSFGLSPAAGFGQLSRNYPSKIASNGLLGLSVDDQTSLAVLNPGQFRGEMSELDDAGTYFDLGPRQVTATGKYSYICTRNNNFSNRDQKGQVIVSDVMSVVGAIGANGGNLMTPSSSMTISVQPRTFGALQKITLQEMSVDVGQKFLMNSGRSINIGDGYASNVYEIQPHQPLTSGGATFTVTMKVDSALGDIKVYKLSDPRDTSWQDVEGCIIENGTATFQALGGGVFVARTTSHTGIVAAIVVAVVVVVGIISIATVIYFRKHPNKYEAIKRRARRLGRNTAANI